MACLRSLLPLSLLPMLLSCLPTAQRRTCEGELAEVILGADGWAVGDNGWGVAQIPRAEAIARVAAAPTHALVESGSAFDECRNGIATHAYFAPPASAGPK